MAEDSKSIKYLLIGALITTVFSGGTLFLQIHSEHSFNRENKRSDLNEKRIEQRTHLLDDFVTTSNELAALRIQLLVADAEASIGVNIQLAGLRRKHGPQRPRKPTLQSRFLEDPDFNSSVEKQLERNVDLMAQILAKNAKLQSIETQASIYFRQNVQDALRQLLDVPYIRSSTLEQFKNSASPETPPRAEIDDALSDRLMSQVLQDAAQDPFKKQTQVVIAAMASEIRQAIEAASN